MISSNKLMQWESERKNGQIRRALTKHLPKRKSEWWWKWTMMRLSTRKTKHYRHFYSKHFLRKVTVFIFFIINFTQFFLVQKMSKLKLLLAFLATWPHGKSSNLQRRPLLGTWQLGTWKLTFHFLFALRVPDSLRSLVYSHSTRTSVTRLIRIKEHERTKWQEGEVDCRCLSLTPTRWLPLWAR